MFLLGTPGAGHTDKLSRLKDLCDQYNMWLHVEGWVSSVNLYNRWSLKISTFWEICLSETDSVQSSKITPIPL